VTTKATKEIVAGVSGIRAQRNPGPKLGDNEEKN